MNRVRSEEDLKNTISGLICRSYFLKDAREKSLHRTEKFVEEYKTLVEQELVRNVLDIIKRQVNPKELDYERMLRKTYFDFRSELLNQNIVLVDSVIIKNFIL